MGIVWILKKLVFLAVASLRELETDKTTISKEKSGPKPIIVPIVLKMAEFDHKVLSHCPLFFMEVTIIGVSDFLH